MAYAVDLAALHANRVRVLALFADPVAPGLDRPYAPGKWTGRQVLLHIADTEAVILDRVRRSLAEPQPLLWTFDQDEWTRHLTAGRDLRVAAALFAAARDSIIDIAGLVDPERLERPVVHTAIGRMRAGDWVNAAASHADHHIAQAEAAVAGRDWTP